MPRVKCYVAQKMTNAYCDEMVADAQLLVQALEYFGFEAFSPVLYENVPNEHVKLEQVSEERLKGFWKRDKEAIKDADIILDYMSCNQSDGVNTEVGYARWGLWKPVVRVWPGVKLNISKLEHDVICDTLEQAITTMIERWGDYNKLKAWRSEMLKRSLPGWVAEQQKMNERYGIVPNLEII